MTDNGLTILDTQPVFLVQSHSVLFAPYIYRLNRLGKSIACHLVQNSYSVHMPPVLLGFVTHMGLSSMSVESTFAHDGICNFIIHTENYIELSAEEYPKKVFLSGKFLELMGGEK